ncbi:hypothetical protein NPIL_243631 [Nephila pilipes]|uniref:Uncharacterized protein n=1 Tax=Nephila pilipes TaxID=299642 RepID=A0A8X6UH61_NEPPI|nr:hypothetical protein NPIL_243631 [Nephila pilipes]
MQSVILGLFDWLVETDDGADTDNPRLQRLLLTSTPVDDDLLPGGTTPKIIFERPFSQVPDEHPEGKKKRIESSKWIADVIRYLVPFHWMEETDDGADTIMPRLQGLLLTSTPFAEDQIPGGTTPNKIVLEPTSSEFPFVLLGMIYFSLIVEIDGIF